jgi:hypothetical protein
MNCIVTAAGPIRTRFQENRETFRESAESAILTNQAICSTHTVYTSYTSVGLVVSMPRISDAQRVTDGERAAPLRPNRKLPPPLATRRRTANTKWPVGYASN